MSLLRVVQCSYTPMNDIFMMHVDVIHSEDPDLDRTYLVVAPRREILTKEDLKLFVEKEIVSQRQAMPDWSGVSWKSSIE